MRGRGPLLWPRVGQMHHSTYRDAVLFLNGTAGRSGCAKSSVSGSKQQCVCLRQFRGLLGGC